MASFAQDSTPTTEPTGPVMPSPAELAVALDRIVAESLRTVAAALSGLYVFFAALHFLTLPKAAAPTMTLVAAATALLLFGLFLALRRRSAPPRWAHPAIAGIAGLVLLNSLLHLHLLPDPYQTTNLMLLVIGAGCLFLSAHWLLVVLAATLAGWAVIAFRAAPSPAWVHFGVALVSTSVLAFIIQMARVRTFQRLEGLRLRDQARAIELEAALAGAEQARREVLASKEEIETAMQATRESEERFRQTSETLRTLIAASPLAIFALDPAGRVQIWNAAAERLFGLPHHEALGRALPDALKDQEVVTALAERVRQGEALADVETRCHSGAGHEIDISFSGAPLQDVDVHPSGVMVVVADISARKKAEENSRRLLLEQTARAQAEAAGQRLAFLADASRILAGSLDYETTLEQIARLAVASLADWCVVDLVDEDRSPRRLVVACSDPSQEAMARELERRYPPNPDHPHPLVRVRRTRQSEIVAEVPDSLLVAIAHDADHLRIMRQLGFKSYVSVPLLARRRLLGAMTFIAAESGRRYGSEDLALAEELARRAALAIDNARLYRELQLADQHKDQFLAMLAHELRNPLAPIRNAVELLKRGGTPEPRLLRAREIIERQVSHQARLLDDLLDVSRITRGKIVLRHDRLDLIRLIRESTEDCRSVLEAAGLTLSLELPEGPVWVEGDATRLAQVVGNLFHNSAKFTDPGGQVHCGLRIADDRISTEVTEDHGGHGADRTAGQESAPPLTPNSVPSEVGVRALQDTSNAAIRSRCAVVTVRDTGIGIDPEMLPHVFDTFAQADRSLDRSRGGLGLGLALVKGLIQLHGGDVRARSEGVGCGAAFTFWLPTTPAPAASEEAVSPAAATAGPIRILIVEDNRDTADSLRELLELSDCTVRVAYSGLAAVAAAREFRPEVVLCDLGLPGMDGYQVAAALKQDPVTATARLIAVTGYGQDEDRRRSQAAGFELHLTKPIEFAELQRLLEVQSESHSV